MSISSGNSNYSSTASAREMEAPEPPKITARNALLDEIRLGDCKLFLFFIKNIKL
jgi:hypothetical protein